MASNATKIRHLIIARLAHEFSNPLGTLYNALEVLEDADDSIREQSISLAKRSVQKIITRLKFYTLAYGGSPSWDPDLINNFLNDKKISLSINEAPRDLEIALNLLVFFAEIAKPGAHIQCTANQLSLNEFVYVDDPILDVLKGISHDTLTPRAYQAYVTAATVKDHNKKLQLETTHKTLTVTIQ